MSDTDESRGGGARRTIVEEGTEFKGTLSASGPVVVLGRVEGELLAPSVEVAESGVLSGRATITELHSRGEIAGEFDAETVELSGRVREGTTIRARSIEVSVTAEAGALTLTFGACALEIGDEPQKAAAIAEALAGPKPALPPKPSDPPAAETAEGTTADSTPADAGTQEEAAATATAETATGKRGKRNPETRTTASDV